MVRLEASKDYGTPGVMIWIEPTASREGRPTMEEKEIGEVDTQPIPQAMCRVESDGEPADPPTVRQTLDDPAMADTRSGGSDPPSS